MDTPVKSSMVGKVYRYAWGPRWGGSVNLPTLSRKGHLCTVLAVGAMNSACVQFDGTPSENRAIVSRNALRKP